ncbi:MAG: ATP-binding cassette domain-containing protein, partial [Rhodobacteraceae bacterium]|nr:ATP-binding cassette domain-containing protein [Paracoccaceae bacterium]
MSSQATSAAPLLQASGLEISFGGVKAADGVNLTVHEGEFVAIIGPNGSGKTTFLNICTGYLKPSRGQVFLAGRDITQLPPRSIARQGIARAFQIPQLFTDHSLIDNLML